MYSGKRILGLMGVKAESDGISCKSTRLYGGKPLMQHTIEDGLQSELIDCMAVSSSSEYLLKLVSDMNAVPIMRPQWMSYNGVNGVPYSQHALGLLPDFDILVTLCVSSPNRDIAELDEAIRWLVDKEAAAVYTVSKIDPKVSPYRAVTIRDDGTITPLIDWTDKEGQLIMDRQMYPDSYIWNGVALVSWVDDLMSKGRFMGGGNRVLAYVNKAPAINLKTEEDYQQLIHSYGVPI